MNWVMVCGIFSIAFAVFHMLFWKLFDWKNDLKKLSIANRAVTQILNLRLIYVFLFVGFLCFRFPEELVETALGNFVLIGCSLFWVGRFIEQFIFLRINHWKVHLLSFLFLVGSIIYLIPII